MSKKIHVECCKPERKDCNQELKVRVECCEHKKENCDKYASWIGIHRGTIVLFTKKRTGVVLADTDEGDCKYSCDGSASYSPGYCCDDWYEEDFEVFEGSVTLSQ